MSELNITLDRHDGQPPLVVPLQPGATVISGTCGLGKSLTLEAINVLFGGDQKDRIKATAGESGTTVSGCGVVLHLSPSRAVLKGEPDVDALDFPLEEMIYPPFKLESAKHLHGIKSFLRMSKAIADPAAFHHLVGTPAEFTKLIPPDAIKTNDLVEMSSKIKRALQALGRKAIEDAEREEQAAAADRDAARSLDRTKETDEKKLSATHLEKVQEHARLKTQWDDYWKGKDAADEARAALAKAGATQAGSEKDAADALARAIEARRVAEVNATEAKQEVARIQALLQAAQATHGHTLVALSNADDTITTAKNAVKAVEDNKATYAAWQKAIDAMAGAQEPDVDQLTAAEEVAEQAAQAVRDGAVLKAALEREAKAAKHQKNADEFRTAAFRWSQAADGTDAVLSKAVNSTRFSVKGEFLMGHLPDAQTLPLYNMSDGQRSLLCILENIDRVCTADSVPRLKVCNVSQRTWQDLPLSLRNHVARYAYERHCCVSAAIVSDDAKLETYVWQVDDSWTLVGEHAPVSPVKGG